MPSVTIDAGVLAAPPAETTPEQVLTYVETLLDWRQLLDERWIPIYMSKQASDALFDDALYPLHDSIGRLFAAHGIVEYAANDIAHVTNALLQLTPHFEDVFQLTEVLATELATHPELTPTEGPRHLKAELERCIVLHAVLRNCCGEHPMDHVLVVKPWSGTTEVQVEALVHDLDHSRDDIKGLPTPPQYLRGCLSVCQNFRQLMSVVNEVAVWQAAETDEAAKRAVCLAVYKSRLERGLEPEWGDMPQFTLGSMFVETTEKCFKANPPNLIAKVLRAMAETLDGHRKDATHWLRTGSGGGNPQRTRNGDKAWRRDVDDEYHLHYWVRENDTIEFGSVVPHNDFSIPY